MQIILKLFSSIQNVLESYNGFISQRCLLSAYLSTCETVWAACIMWAACITTIHAAVSQTKWILCCSEIEHITPKARDNCQIRQCYNLVKKHCLELGGVCFFLLIWRDDFLGSGCSVQPSEFYFKNTPKAKAENLQFTVGLSLTSLPFVYLCCHTSTQEQPSSVKSKHAMMSKMIKK